MTARAEWLAFRYVVGAMLIAALLSLLGVIS